MVKYKIPMEITVGYLAGLSMLLTLVKVPVWAVFFTWAGYFMLGTDMDAIRTFVKAVPVGGLFGIVAVIGFHYAVPAMGSTPNIIPTIIVETLTVIALMFAINKLELNGGATFIGFASYFSTFYASQFYALGGPIPNAFSAFGWQLLANLLGILVFGPLSIKLSFPYEE